MTCVVMMMWQLDILVLNRLKYQLGEKNTALL